MKQLFQMPLFKPGDAVWFNDGPYISGGIIRDVTLKAGYQPEYRVTHGNSVTTLVEDELHGQPHLLIEKANDTLNAVPS